MNITARMIRRILVAAAVIVLAGVAVLLVRTTPLPAAPNHSVVKPSPKVVPGMGVCWVEFERNSVPGQVATAGFTHMRTWELTASGLLVRHPEGNILIDVGNSSHFQEEIADYPFWSHLHFEILTGGKSAAHPVSDVLRANGIDPSALFAVLPSHIHMDHAGGLMDLPKVPVLLSQEEIDFANRNRDTRTIQVVPAHARTIQGRITPLKFLPRPYETFDESADIFGDGSVVVVKLPGHTPGSVGTFINLSPSLRIFHVGDAANVREAIDRRLSKSFIMATTDNDLHQANITVAKLAQLHSLDPTLLIIPAHDREAWKRAFNAEPGCTH